MFNEKSLENLKAPKPKREGYGYRYSLPQDKIDELFTYLAEGMSLKKASKEAKICFETARKYFRQGDEKRGIKPLQYRLTMFQEKVSEKFNVLAEERRQKLLAVIQSALATIEKDINAVDCKGCDKTGIQTLNDGTKIQCPICNGAGTIMGPLMEKRNLKDLERLVKLEFFLMGGVTTKEKEQKFMSAEQMSGDQSA